MDKTVLEFYGNRARIRVCCLCWQGEKLLMVNHKGLYGHDFWAPPGGGVEFGESAQANLERELEEETGLKGTAGEFLFVCEFIQKPFHAIELFFAVDIKGGHLVKGTDPEVTQNQIISEVKYLSIDEIDRMPENYRHGLFKRVKSVEKIRSLVGYMKI